jgi:carbonic anhydrase/acetyltransferase-like protein (isoleucine patch superfamily)
MVAQRFLVPAPLVTVYYLFKFGCRVSPRAEVELSPRLTIGKGTQVGSFTKVKATDGDMAIGARVSIGTCCFIAAAAGGITVGDDSMIGPNVTIIGNSYRYDRLDVPVSQQAKTSKGIHIGRDVWIGAGVTVVDGSDIGDHAIVHPNSVVTGRIPPRSIASGSPARVVFERR